MDVRLPDGTIIRNVPEGTTKAQIMAKLGRSPEPQAPALNPAAANPEVSTPLGTIQGETSTGFNPAAALIKAGDTMDSINKGIQALKFGPGDKLREMVGLEPNRIAEGLEADRKAAKPAMKELTDVHPGSAMIGDAAVYMAAPNKAAPILAAAEMGTPVERLTRAGVAFAGNKIGESAGKALGRVAQPTRAAELSAAQRAANESAQRLGVKLSAGEASGNRALKWAESATGDLPIASGMATKRITANQRAMNSAVLRQLGQSGDEITEEALARARSEIGSTYSRILDPAKIELDNSFRAEVKAITGSKVMKELRDESVDSMLEQFRNMPQGKVKVSGEWFQQNKTALDAQIRSAFNNGQPGKARALEQFEKALDRAAMRSMPEAERAAYKAAQKQWATLRILETGKVVEGGNVMPGRLNSAMESRYKAAFKEGKIKGETADVARLGSVLRPPPNSGTTPRAIYSGLTGGAMFAEPMTAATMLAGPASVQALTTSPVMRAYMTKGLMNITPEMEERLMLLGGKAGLLGYAGMMD